MEDTNMTSADHQKEQGKTKNLNQYTGSTTY